MTKKKRLDEIYRAVFVIGGLSDGEIDGKRSKAIERDIAKAIKTMFSESGLLKTVKVNMVRVPRLEEGENEETT